MSGGARPLVRVVLTGAECAGKTNLAEWLAVELGIPWSGEYAREHADAHGGGEALTAADVEPIARGQLANEDRAIARAREQGSAMVLHDTDLLSTLVYATQYYGAGSVPSWLPEVLAARTPALYLLCDIDVPFAGDGVRDAGQDRAKMQQAFEAALATQDARVVQVRGGRAERRAMVKRVLEHVAERS